MEDDLEVGEANPLLMRRRPLPLLPLPLPLLRPLRRHSGAPPHARRARAFSDKTKLSVRCVQNRAVGYIELSFRWPTLFLQLSEP